MKVGRPFFCGEFDERIKPAKSFYIRFAGLPQTPRQIPGDLREYPQTPKHFPRDLREYPQTPKHFPWDLRDSRKRQGISRETCGSTRKHQSISRGTCGTSAGHFQKHFGRLQRAIKDILLGLGSPFFHRTHVVYEITHFLLAIACKMRLKCHRQSEMRRKTRFACRRQVEMRFSGLIPYVCP